MPGSKPPGDHEGLVMSVDAHYGRVVVQVKTEPGYIAIGRGNFVNDDVHVMDGVQRHVAECRVDRASRVTVVPVVPVPGVFPVVSASTATWFIWPATWSVTPVTACAVWPLENKVTPRISSAMAPIAVPALTMALFLDDLIDN